MNNNKDKAIKAAPIDRDCENCIHEVQLDEFCYCDSWDCDFKPKVKKDE